MIADCTTIEYNRNYQNLKEYIDRIKSTVNNDVSNEVLDTSWRLWDKLQQSCENLGMRLSVPSACPGTADNFMLTWSNDDRYMECEIFGNGDVEFFYKNKVTGELWGKDCRCDLLVEMLSDRDFEGILEKALFFCIQLHPAIEVGCTR